MAQPMDVDSSLSDFDNKENTCYSNVLPRTPCTEKGYEELDVSELNMKLRYSLTPANSPMSKSYTANNLEKNFETSNNNESGNLTRSLHSAIPSDSLVKSQKVIPLQSLSADQLDNNRSALRFLEPTNTEDIGNVTVTVSRTSDDENMSFPSSTSSMVHTPEATTPTKEIPKSDGSPILRGLKNVLNMFRPSQSPIPSEDVNDNGKEILSPPIVTSPDSTAESRQVLASTPLNPHKTISKSPNRDSLVFNEDLEKELEWKDETTILFSKEKIPVHKLFFQQSMPEAKQTSKVNNELKMQDAEEKLDTTVEFMDISYNDSVRDKTLSEIQVEIINKSDVMGIESDSEFVDCETTFSKNESQVSFKSQEDDADEVVENKHLLNLTNETLDTLSVKSDDISITSTGTTRASINTLLTENVPELSEVTENYAKNEGVNEDIAPATADLNLACKSQLNTTVDKTLKLTQIDLGKSNQNVTQSTPLVSNNCNMILDQGPKNIEFNTAINDVIITQSEIVNKTVKDIANTSPALNVISQIPLIADPRVLLFNISQDPVKEIEVQQDTVNTLGMLPVDIPLPDMDADIDNMVSLPTEDYENKVQDILSDVKDDQTNPETIVDLTPVKAAPIETEMLDFDSLPEVKNLLADIAVNKDVLKPEFHRVLIFNEFITNEQTIDSDVIKAVQKNVEHVVKPQNMEPRIVNEKIKHNIEVLTSVDQTKTESVFGDENVANDIAFIPEVEDISVGSKEVTKVIREELSVPETKEPKEHPDIKCETPITETEQHLENKFECEIREPEEHHESKSETPITDSVEHPESKCETPITEPEEHLENKSETPITEPAVHPESKCETPITEPEEHLENKSETPITEPAVHPESKCETPITEPEVHPETKCETPITEPKEHLENKIKCEITEPEECHESKSETPITEPEVNPESKCEIPITEPEDHLENKNKCETLITKPEENPENKFKCDTPFTKPEEHPENKIKFKTTITEPEEYRDKKCEIPITITPINESAKDNLIAHHNSTLGQSLVGATVNEDLDKAEELIANETIELIPQVKTEDELSVYSSSEKVSISDNGIGLQTDMITPQAVTEEIKMDVTFEELNNESDVDICKAIAFDIVNKTIEMATSPIVEHYKISSPLKENEENDAIAVPHNVISEMDTVNQEIVIPVHKENVVKITASETPIVSEYIINQYEIIAPTNDIATVESITTESKYSEVNKTIKSEEIKVILNASDVNVPIVSQIQEIAKEDKPLDAIINQLIKNNEEKIDITIDEEIIASENNSPFVSLAGDSKRISETKQVENFEHIENPFETKTTISMSPPISPKIISKGYNFNFDEIDNPFATKTNIRQSPPPCVVSNKSFDQLDRDLVRTEFPKRNAHKNRRKSQPETKKPVSVKKKLNSTVIGTISVDMKTPVKIESNQEPVFERIEEKASVLTPNLKVNPPIPVLSVDEIEQDVSMSELPEICNNSFENHATRKSISAVELPKIDYNTFEGKVGAENKPNASNITSEIKHEETFKIDAVVEPETVILNAGSQYSFEPETKNISSSEQSTYFSAGTSSSELVGTKNVFNLPEIDDINFNPFVTKSKMRQSPPPGEQIDKTVATQIDELHAPDSTRITEQNHDATINVKSPKESSATVDKMAEQKLETCQEEKDSSNNISNATWSSKATDEKDNTVREIHTEDEDTIEGPFLEVEDFNNDDKMSDFEGENVDMMHFNDLPPQEHDDNADAGELFIDAEAFEFLLNQNNSNVVSDSGKESLFLKFDPLFAKRMSSDGVLAALSKVQKRQSTPKKVAKPNRDVTFVQKSPIAGPSNMNATCDININNQDESNDDINVTVSKPMMVVNPAVNPVAMPRNKSLTPTRTTNRRSLTFTSPAIAVIDRLLSMSANNSLVGHETSVTEINREQNEADLALTQLRELLADKEINVYNLRTESKQLKERLANLESQMKSLEATSEDRLKKINELTDRLNEKTKINRSMATVVEEYERTIASLISEAEQDRKRHAQERIELMKERDEQTAHLASMEVSFSDLHSKYEKSKQVILGFKTNEEIYKKSIKEFEENLSKMQNNYELLKQHATSKLNHANDELQKMNRAHEAEVLKLNAMIKRKDLHITSLEETLLQKTKANEELTAICDELINKVG